MQNPRHPITWAFFLILATGLGCFLSLCSQAFSFTILNHAFRVSYLLPLFMIFAFILLYSSWLLLARWDAKLLGADRGTTLKSNIFPFLPLSVFLLTPLLLQKYLNRSDFFARLTTLALAATLCALFLKCVQWYRHGRIQPAIDMMIDQFSQLSSKKKIGILFLIAFLLYNLCAFVLVSKGISFSGDEPYYLLTTHSLLKDKDINVANNYRQQDYFAFYDKEKNPRFKLGMYARAGKKGRAYIYPINLPGISVLILPFYWLSQFFKGSLLTFILKASLSVWASLFGIQLYLLAKDLWHKEKTALTLWFFFAFSAPVLFFATHIYSEIPIALFSLYVYRKVRSERSLSLFHYVFLGFLLSLFFWFGLKYNMLFGPLFLVSLYFLIKTHKARMKILAFLVFPALSLSLFYYVIYSLYGSFSPFSVYEGVLTPERLSAFKQAALSAPLSMRIESFFDYFIDQRDGLLLYSPFYFFAILGFIDIFRRSKKDVFILLFLTLPYLLNYAFFTHRQGYSPQGRILAPISWVGAIAIGYFYVHNRKKLYSFVFWIFSASSIIIAALLLQNPEFLYQPTTNEFTSRAGDFFVWLSNMHIFLPHLLPSFIKINNLGYIPNYGWILAIVVFASVYAFARRPLELRSSFYTIFGLAVLGFTFLMWSLYPLPSLYPTQIFRYSPQMALGFYLSPMGKGVVVKENKQELYLHRQNDYKILFSSRRELEQIHIAFGSDRGEYDTHLSFFDMPFVKETTAYETSEVALSPEAYYPFKNLYLYEINLNITKRSSESMLIHPFYFKITPSKER
jgi:hypothetical protein